MADELTAEAFSKRLEALRKAGDWKTVRMGDIFKLGKEFQQMPVDEMERLMESDIHKMRVGALSIMGQCAKGKNCSPKRLKDLYDLYIRRHDLINDWGLVDLAAYYVVGQYLADKSQKVLYRLARSNDPWERRTSIVATAHFILKLKQTEDTFAIAGLLVDDDHKFVNTGVGWMLRAAGDVDREGLVAFLDENAIRMPRVALRAAIEKFDPPLRAAYAARK